MQTLKLCSAFVVIYSIYSLLLLLLSCLGIINSAVIFTALALSVVIYLAAQRHNLIPQLPNTERLPTEKLFILSISLIVLVPIIFLPHTATDDLIYHLPFPRSILVSGRLVHDPLMLNFDLAKFFEFPLLAFQASHFAYAKTVNVVVTVLCTLFVFSQTLSKRNPSLAVLTSLAFLLTPIVWDLSNSCYVEIFVTLATLLAWKGYNQYLENNNREHWYFTCLMLSVALATKESSLLIIAPVLAYEFFRKKDSRLYYSGICLILALGLPWAIRNSIYHHNPFFPLLGEFLPSPLVSTDRYVSYNRFFSMFHSGTSTTDYILAPFRIMFAHLTEPMPYRTNIYGGSMSIALIAAYLGFLTCKKNKIFNLIFIAPLFFGWLFKTQQIRFLLPLLCIGLCCVKDFPKAKVIKGILILAILQGSYALHENLKFTRTYDFLIGKLPSGDYLAHNIHDAHKMATKMNIVAKEHKIRIKPGYKVYLVGGFGRSYGVNLPVTTNLYFDLEPIINSFRLGSEDSIKLDLFWREHRLSHLAIWGDFDHRALRRDQYFNWEAYSEYLSMNFDEVYSDNEVRIYQNKNML